LRKWDAKRRIVREQVYKKLSVQRKEDLLSKIGFTTFERGEYFFKQREIEHYIADYIRNLPDAKTDPDALLLDSGEVLKSIEAQHGLLVERARGIYSFSHLTFQEYFTAREIVAKSDIALLVSKITENRWREVFLLTAGMMRNADELVQRMKQRIDGLVAGDEKLQQFMIWLDEKARSVKSSNKLVSVRSFYLNLFYSLELDHRITHAFYPTIIDFPMFNSELSQLVEKNIYSSNDMMSLDYWLTSTLELVIVARWNYPEYVYFDEAVLCLSDASRCNLNSELKKVLYKLSEELPYSGDQDALNKCNNFIYLKENAWIKELKNAMIQYCNFGHNWQFSKKQEQLFQQYYEANKLLVNCLNSDCYISQEVRQEIEDTFLLPIAEIEKRKSHAN
jgi:predicted NACHT family NTPase